MHLRLAQPLIADGPPAGGARDRFARSEACPLPKPGPAGALGARDGAPLTAVSVLPATDAA